MDIILRSKEDSMRTGKVLLAACATVLLAFALALVCAQFSPAQAAKEEWVPEKPISIIVPFSAGGGSDIRARIISAHWPRYLPGNQPVVVLNKPGGGSVIGLTEAYRAKPDGYTLVLSDTVPMVLNQLTSDVKYDGRKFEGIGQTNAYTRVLETNLKTIPDIKTWDQVLAKIYDLKLATVGFGSAPHMAAVAIGNIGKFYDPGKLRFVHYKGTSEAIAGFQRKEVDLMIGAVESHWKYVGEGIMDFLIVFADNRHGMCPNVPTSIEAKMTKAKEINAITYGNAVLYAPPGTPPLVLKTLADSFEKTMKDPKLKADVEKVHDSLTWLSRERVNQITRDLYELWAKQEEALKIFKSK
jgi:tripartite-type tricarboxylate transporter receptor subunit TctC